MKRIGDKPLTKAEINARYYARNRERILTTASETFKRKYAEDETFREEIKAKAKAWADANPELIKAKTAKWYEENKEEIRATNKKYREENKEKIKIYDRNRYAANAEQIRDQKNNYNKKNPEKRRIFLQNKRARIRADGGKLSRGLIDLLRSEQGDKCPYCFTSLSKVGFHLDHYVPIIRGGRNIDDNMQLTCPTCNYKKNGKDPMVFLCEVSVVAQRKFNYMESSR